MFNGHLRVKHYTRASKNIIGKWWAIISNTLCYELVYLFYANSLLLLMLFSFTTCKIFYSNLIIHRWCLRILQHLEGNKAYLHTCLLCKLINVREYRRDNQKRKIPKKNKAKIQHNMYCTPLYDSKHKSHWIINVKT